MKRFFGIIAFCTISFSGITQQGPVIPSGTDAYLMWDKWPLLRTGIRAYMRSTYDRRGGGADAGNFLFMREEDHNVTLDVKGRGALYFFRANHWHGSPWHFIADGIDHVVKETATDDPVNAKHKIQHPGFIPSKAFPPYLNWTWGNTKGADLIWSPVSFRDSLRIAYSRTHYGTGYYIYHLYADESLLSQKMNTWNPDKHPDKRIIDLIRKSGSDIAPVKIAKTAGNIKLAKGSNIITDLKSNPSSIRAIKISVPINRATDLERIRLLITWDAMEHPSVNAPLCLFFGAGTLYNRNNAEYLVKAFPVNIRFDYAERKVHMACYFPMPFRREAKIELFSDSALNENIEYEIRYQPLRDTVHNAYFHATYKNHPKPDLGKEIEFLDTKGVENVDVWSGHFVGTSFIFSHNSNLHTLEGDPRFFFDDSKTPQCYGTGTEEWAGGGDYWGGENMTLPFAGHPCGAPHKDSARHQKDNIQSAYRFLLADLMPFGRRAVIHFEHSENVSQEHYESVAYWYGLPVAGLIKSDSLDIGDVKSEMEHRYYSPSASDVEIISSRYEWGPDKLPAGAWGMDLQKQPGYQDKVGTVIYPEHKEDGRYMSDTSIFTVRTNTNNQGVLLRRTLDYSFPNQTAEVYVSEYSQTNQDITQWKKVGIWYLAGSNTCVYSRPPRELDERVYNVITSNRRFRDDEFMIPSSFTRGRTSLRVMIKFIDNHQQLYPGVSFPKSSAWSELRYDVYSIVN